MQSSNKKYYYCFRDAGELRYYKIVTQDNKKPEFITQLVVEKGNKLGVHHCLGIFQMKYCSFQAKFGEILPERSGKLSHCSESDYKLAYSKLAKKLY